MSLGRLSMLTPDVVSAAAASEIKTGRRVGLNWNMRKLEYSQFGRQRCNHTIKPLYGPGGIGLGACFDDIYDVNPRMFRIVTFFAVPSPLGLYWHGVGNVLASS